MPEESPGQQPCASHACMNEYTDISWADGFRNGWKEADMETMKRPNYVEELLEIFRSPLNKEELLDKISDYQRTILQKPLNI